MQKLISCATNSFQLSPRSSMAFCLGATASAAAAIKKLCNMSASLESSVQEPCDGAPATRLQDERNNQGVDCDSLRERHAKKHGHEELIGRLGIAPDRLHRFACDLADRESRQDAADGDGQAFGQHRD